MKPQVGKTASQINLWENKEIETRLRRMMGADYQKMKTLWKIETPLKKFGDFMMLTGCDHKDSPKNQYAIFLDTAEGDIDVFHIAGGKTRIWKETRGIELPPPFAEELEKLTSGRSVSN
jgi:hypothetical protein